MPAPALVGVDIGTSAVKVVAFDSSGRLLALRRAGTPTTRLPGGEAEHDADALWALVARLTGEVVGELKGARVEAVATASVAEAGVPLDKDGQAVGPAIAWYDSRGVAQADWWAEHAGNELVYRVTGQPIDSHYGVNKLMWLREHEPEAFARARHWLSLADLVTYRMCGTYATDFTLASRTMCFDQRRLDWSDELLKLAGLDRAIFPGAHPSGTRVGAVTTEAAAATGLPAGAPVVTGGHDRLCAAFASRGRHAVPVDSVGSAEALVVPVDHYAERAPVEAGSISCYADVVPGQYVFSARIGYSGALVDWYRREVLQTASSTGTSSLDAEIAWPLSFSGLVCYPSFGRVLAPAWDEAAAAGAILGLTLGHRQSHILQALVESVGYSLRANLEWLERLVGSIPALRVEGRLAESRVWAQLRADVTGRQIEVVRLEEATALGAALLAGVGGGLFADHAAAADAVTRDLQTWQPEPGLAATYADVFEHGFRLLPRLIGEVSPALARAAAPAGAGTALGSATGSGTGLHVVVADEAVPSS
jgi:xylulokinase